MKILAKRSAASCDWLTLTSRLAQGAQGWAGAFENVLEQAKLRGDVPRDMALLGYRGRSVGGAFMGMRPDGCLVRLSGANAESYGSTFEPHLNRVTRLDAALTVELEEPHPGLLRDLYRWVVSGSNAGYRPNKHTLIQSEFQAQTIYVGSRASEWFGRVYDKGLEQGGKEAGKLVRWEIEYKGEMATKAARAFFGSTLRHSVMEQTLCADFQSRNMPTPEAENHLAADLRTAHITPDTERRLKWLREQVAPTIAELARSASFEEIVLALFSRVVSSEVTAQEVIDVLKDLRS